MVFGSSKDEEDDIVEPKGFDDFELRLGDVMRGERATMGKSLLDVQRELRIKASYIAAIENCDPDAFDTPGFIAGYVRSYARYLNMDPDAAFETFCAESGFQVAHGMSAQASVVRKPTREERLSSGPGRDMFASPATPFIPSSEGLLSRIEPGAIGSMLVLLGLISVIGYGGYAVLREVQQVQVTPVEQAPVVLADIDPVAGASAPVLGAPTAPGARDLAPRANALDRLYRPQALDVPVLVSRDAPIATLDPRRTGALAGLGATRGALDPEADADATFIAGLDDAYERPVPGAQGIIGPQVPKVVEDLDPTIRMVAAYPAWVRVRSAEGNVLFETIMQPGDTYEIPATEVPPTLRTGESAGIYFAMGSKCYGPVGERGAITSNVPLERVTPRARSTACLPTCSKSTQPGCRIFPAKPIKRRDTRKVIAACCQAV